MSALGSVLVIGGSGFIGTRLVQRLISTCSVNVKIFDKLISEKFPNSTILGDVRSVYQLRDSISEKSILVNLAAEHRDDVRPISLYDEVNVSGAKNICTVAREKKIQTIIFTSTVAVYGYAPVGTNESGRIAPFNDYGRTKYEAEQIFRAWQAEAPKERTLVIIRPTVVFGENNRGNVFNLLRQIASGRFVMVGNGLNRKSMAYVENVAAFIEYVLDFKPGLYIYNYTDKPDLTMKELVGCVNKLLCRSIGIGFRVPFLLGLLIGFCFDLMAKISGIRFPISVIRVKKFCTNSVYDSAIGSTGFIPPVPLIDGLKKTIFFEFIEVRKDKKVSYL